MCIIIILGTWRIRRIPQIAYYCGVYCGKLDLCVKSESLIESRLNQDITDRRLLKREQRTEHDREYLAHAAYLSAISEPVSFYE